MEIQAHAKINLTLAVTGKREDGYHTLATVMQEISLCDRLTVEKRDAGIEFTCDDPRLPTDETNLCVKAAKAYLAAAGEPGGAFIGLEKKIPFGAGLGGGSSDAAAILTALAKLYPADPDPAALALGIGADVPFFLTGGTCLCTGIGEVVTPLYFPGKIGLWCVVAKEAEGLSTPAVYQAYDKKPKSGGIAVQDMIEAMTWGAPEAIFPFLKNDLEDAAISLSPKIRETRTYLKIMGAEAAQMTGSGSAVFALFRDRDAAAWAAANVKKRGAETFLCTLI